MSTFSVGDRVRVINEPAPEDFPDHAARLGQVGIIEWQTLRHVDGQQAHVLKFDDGENGLGFLTSQLERVE
jgi:hypothetical protein